MSKKRIPCPYCGELILPEAKKCRFCNEKLTKKPVSLRGWYWSWVFSIITFFIALFFIRRAPLSAANFWLAVLGIIVLVGTVSYLFLVTKVLGSLKTRTAQKYGVATLITFITFFALLFNYNTVEAALGFSPPHVTQSTPSPIPLPTPFSTSSPSPTPASTQQNTTPVRKKTSNQITCTGPDGKTFTTTQEECEAFNKAWGNVPPPNPNEYIRCNIHPNCGGGYKEMTRASCERMTCCHVNDSWVLRDKDQCNTEQKQQTDAEWIAFCNNLYNPDSCSTYWDSGTSNWYNCRSDAFSGRTRCYNHQ